MSYQYLSDGNECCQWNGNGRGCGHWRILISGQHAKSIVGTRAQTAFDRLASAINQLVIDPLYAGNECQLYC